MKNEIIRYFYCLIFIALFAAISLNAEAVHARGADDTLPPATAINDQLHNRKTIGISAQPTVGVISVANRLNFILGQNFTVALYDADCFLSNKACYIYVVAGLAELIDHFEAQPEGQELRKVQSSIIRGSATPEGVRNEIKKVADSYQANLPSERQWYFRSAVELVELVVAAKTGNIEASRNSLSKIGELAKIAPPGTATQLVARLNEIGIFDAGNDLNNHDYENLVAMAGRVINAMEESEI